MCVSSASVSVLSVIVVSFPSAHLFFVVGFRLSCDLSSRLVIRVSFSWLDLFPVSSPRFDQIKRKHPKRGCLYIINVIFSLIRMIHLCI